MKTRNPWLFIGGVSSFAIALLHLVIIFIGADAYRYFGAGEEMARGAEQGSLVPAFITLGAISAFMLFGLYALSGAGLIKKLWKLKPILLAITTIYILRGCGFFIEIVGILYDYDVPVRHAVFSFTSLSLGISYLAGVIRGWKDLSMNGKKTDA